MIDSLEILTQFKSRLETCTEDYECSVNDSAADFYEFSCGELDVDINFRNGDCELRLSRAGENPFAIYWDRTMDEQQLQKYSKLQGRVIEAYFSSRLGRYENTRSYIFGLVKRSYISYVIKEQDGTFSDLTTGHTIPSNAPGATSLILPKVKKKTI